MKVQIKRWDNDRVIHEGEFESVKDCLEDGVRKGISFIFAELNGAELNGAKLNGAELNGAKLNYAELNRAKLNRAELNYAELNRAKLNRAELNGAELNYAELNRAELNGAELNGAELNGAELNGAELNYAELNGAKLNGAKLNGAKLPERSYCINTGEDYFLFISPQLVQAGCQSHSPDEWRAMSKRDIADMDSRKALKFYPRLLDIMDFYLGKGDRPDWLEG